MSIVDWEYALVCGCQIKELDTIYQIPREYSDVKIPTIEDALMVFSGSLSLVTFHIPSY